MKIENARVLDFHIHIPKKRKVFIHIFFFFFFFFVFFQSCATFLHYPPLFMPPTLKGHIAFGLFVRVYVCYFFLETFEC